MKRRHLNRLARVRIFDAHHGTCSVCHFRIQVGQAWEIEHLKPLADGGADVPLNMAPVHAKCHKPKTAKEAGERSKVVRIRANHLGVRKASKAKFACGKDSDRKKKLSGEVVTRVSQASEHRRVMEARVIR